MQQCRWAHMTCCCYFHTTNTDAIKNASWTSGSFTGTKPGPPPSPPGPCAVASQAECGVGSGPYTGKTPAYCAGACKWNGSACLDLKPAAYPMPGNKTLVALAGAASPLLKMPAGPLVWSFYGDSITWVNQFEPVIKAALEVPLSIAKRA